MIFCLESGVSDLEYHKNPDKRMLTIMKDIPEEFSQINKYITQCFRRKQKYYNFN
ncbi:hypothetical protein CoNPh11_CDS0181 [Staphylococcus phage S-CoN_Ph11]|nr:hypothetical protein CoNPh11_CDS0181 [Staphylococcus phage S-CoN_Ph11]